MYQVKTLNNISPKGLELFDHDRYLVNDGVPNPDAILVRSYVMHEMPLPENLIAIGRAGAGVNNIPVDQCSEKGIIVFNTPGANANAVKELTIAGLLLSSRKIAEGIEWAKSLAREGSNIPKLVEKGKAQFTGPELEGKKLGVIGLGAIGVMVANAAKSMGMEVEGFDPYISVDAAWSLSRSVKKAADFQSLLESSDFITLHVPLTAETKHMIAGEQMSLMKKGVRLLNFSRGELVNHDDLKNALEDGTITTYVTDFPDEKVLNMDGVIAIPHLGASTPESEDNCAVMATRQLIEFLEDGTINNSVNYPNCELSRSSQWRMTIAHKNIPNMVGQISTVLAKQEINILNMINKSKGKQAYTIIDAEDAFPEKAIQEIQSIQGVLKVRIL